MFNSTHSNSAFCQSQITGLNSPVGDKDGINPSVETVTSTLPITYSYLPVRFLNSRLLSSCSSCSIFMEPLCCFRNSTNRLEKRVAPFKICTLQPLVQAIGCSCLR